MDNKYQYAVYAQMKDEDNVIDQWINHYIGLGFEHCYIMNDQSENLFSEKIKNHRHYDKITLIDVDFTIAEYNSGDFVNSKLYNKIIWGGNKNAKQNYLLNTFKELYKNDIEWLLICDADEFLYLRDDCTISQYIEKKLEKYPDMGQICFNWVNYGTSYHSYFPEGDLFENFVLSEHKIHSYLKSIVNLNNITQLSIHLSKLNGKSTYIPDKIDIIEINEFQKKYGKTNTPNYIILNPNDVNAFLAHYITLDCYTLIYRKLKRLRAGSHNEYRDNNLILYWINNINYMENHLMLKYSEHKNIKHLIPNKKLDINLYNKENDTNYKKLIDVVLHFYDNKTTLHYT